LKWPTGKGLGISSSYRILQCVGLLIYEYSYRITHNLELIMRIRKFFLSYSVTRNENINSQVEN